MLILKNLYGKGAKGYITQTTIIIWSSSFYCNNKDESVQVLSAKKLRQQINHQYVFKHEESKIRIAGISIEYTTAEKFIWINTDISYMNLCTKKLQVLSGKFRIRMIDVLPHIVRPRWKCLRLLLMLKLSLNSSSWEWNRLERHLI